MIREEEKKIEKILKDLANLQVRACVLSSQNAKKQGEKVGLISSPAEGTVEEIEEIASEFADITRKLIKKVNSPAIEKTLNKLELSSCYNPGLATFYLTQLIHEMKGVADKAQTILSTEKFEAQYKSGLEQKRIDADAKKLVAFDTVICPPPAKQPAEILAHQMI